MYLHDVPTSSDDWLPALERTGGVAPDLIGFGRSAKGGHLEYTPAGLAAFVLRLLDELGLERVALAGHGWGAIVALELAARAPERVARLALVAPLPLVEGFEWGRRARILRTPVLGELAMGATTRALLGRQLRRASADAVAWPPERLAAAWRFFDQGTQRATLRLHRRTDRHHLSHAARPQCPTLLVCGTDDPELAAAQADALAAVIRPDRRIDIAGARHWPWLERAEGLEAVAGFVGGES